MEVDDRECRAATECKLRRETAVGDRIERAPLPSGELGRRAG